MKIKTSAIILITLLGLLSCGKKDEKTNVVNTTPSPGFPQTQTYTNCNNQQGHFFSLVNLCQDLQINYSGNGVNSNNFCNPTQRRSVFNQYCSRYSWQPRVVMNSMAYNQSNLKVVCHLSDPTRSSSTISRVVHRGQTVLVHPNFKAVINKSNISYTTNLNINLYDHQNRFIGSTSYTFSQNNRHHSQAYQVFSHRAQINCRPIQVQDQTSSSSSYNFSWSFFSSF